MTERLNKLFVLLKHSLEIERLRGTIPSGDEDAEMLELLQKSHEFGELNAPLLVEIGEKFFAEQHGVTVGKSVVRVYSADGDETTFLLTDAVIQRNERIESDDPTHQCSYILMGNRYIERNDSCEGHLLQDFNPTLGHTIQKLKDLD